MKMNLSSTLTAATVLIVALWAMTLPAADTSPATRVGIYDSRAVAYAHFVTPEYMQPINQLMQAARKARDTGQTNRFQALVATLQQKQDEIHREIFSTAPAADAMTALKKQIPAS
jgi:hypothetical protein